VGIEPPLAGRLAVAVKNRLGLQAPLADRLEPRKNIVRRDSGPLGSTGRRLGNGALHPNIPQQPRALNIGCLRAVSGADRGLGRIEIDDIPGH
jgi:hypothetical protein